MNIGACVHHFILYLYLFFKQYFHPFQSVIIICFAYFKS